MPGRFPGQRSTIVFVSAAARTRAVRRKAYDSATVNVRSAPRTLNALKCLNALTNILNLGTNGHIARVVIELFLDRMDASR
jgi:hypothetical protein